VLGLGFSLSLALGTSVQIIEGRNLAPEGERLIWKLPFLIAIPVGTALGVLLVFSRQPTASLLTNTPQVLLEAETPLLFAAVCMPLIFVSSLLAGVLRASGHSSEVLVVNSVATWIFQIGGALVLALVLPFGLAGAFAAYLLYYLAKTLGLTFALRSRGYVLREPVAPLNGPAEPKRTVANEHS
jgi:Na+-driven multidrug efflux pump